MELIFEIIFEAVFDIIFEGSFEISTDKRRPRWLRDLALIVFGIIFLGIIALVVFAGFLVLEDGLIGAIVVWLMALGFVIATIWAFYREYKERKGNL